MPPLGVARRRIRSGDARPRSRQGLDAGQTAPAAAGPLHQPKPAVRTHRPHRAGARAVDRRARGFRQVDAGRDLSGRARAAVVVAPARCGRRRPGDLRALSRPERGVARAAKTHSHAVADRRRPARRADVHPPLHAPPGARCSSRHGCWCSTTARNWTRCRRCMRASPRPLADIPDGCRLIAISREPPPAAYVRAAGGPADGADRGRRAALRHRGNPGAAATARAQLVCRRRCAKPPTGWAAAMILMLASRTAPGPAASGTRRSRGRAAAPVRAVRQRGAGVDAVLAKRGAAARRVPAQRDGGDGRAAERRTARRCAARGPGATQPVHRPPRGAAPVYAFHALFSEFLRARAAAELDVETLRALRVEAAALLVSAGHADAALGRTARRRGLGRGLCAAAGARRAPGRARALGADRPGAGGAAAGLARAAAGRATGWAFATWPSTRPLRWPTCSTPTSACVEQGDTAGAFETAAAAADAIVFQGANYDALAPWMPILEAQAPAYLAQRDAELDLRVLPGLLAAFVHRDPGHALTAPLADAAEHMLDQPLGASQRILVGSLAYYLLWTGPDDAPRPHPGSRSTVWSPHTMPHRPRCCAGTASACWCARCSAASTRRWRRRAARWPWRSTVRRRCASRRTC